MSDELHPLRQFDDRVAAAWEDLACGECYSCASGQDCEQVSLEQVQEWLAEDDICVEAEELEARLAALPPWAEHRILAARSRRAGAKFHLPGGAGRPPISRHSSDEALRYYRDRISAVNERLRAEGLRPTKESCYPIVAAELKPRPIESGALRVRIERGSLELRDEIDRLFEHKSP